MKYKGGVWFLLFNVGGGNLLNRTSEFHEILATPIFWGCDFKKMTPVKKSCHLDLFPGFLKMAFSILVADLGENWYRYRLYHCPCGKNIKIGMGGHLDPFFPHFSWKILNFRGL